MQVVRWETGIVAHHGIFWLVLVGSLVILCRAAFDNLVGFVVRQSIPLDSTTALGSCATSRNVDGRRQDGS